MSVRVEGPSVIQGFLVRVENLYFHASPESVFISCSFSTTPINTQLTLDLLLINKFQVLSVISSRRGDRYVILCQSGVD